ncbi:LacI family DNA-binding transcriptional regulator [Pectobacteriaceae bacterium CE70]|nr:LacI family DNA-binding transcriptional regulator [Pectobacteriaceae bacterium C52]WJV67021.1 LacI family DNA-binding transcriptional regulator [Pectobacteriaceae bacterium CE70]WJY11006.1 LacI family DNA-binding transcriptional regulator [Pectobacteriaceae bacterium C80]
MREKRRRSTGKSTLADIARLVGVSAMTASRALRVPEKVSPALREKIEAAVAELGYVPNLAASGLASATSRLIIMVVPSFAIPGCAAVSGALQAVLKPYGYNMMVVEANHSSAGESQLIEMLLSYNPAAMVHFNFDNAEDSRRLLVNSGLPVLEVGGVNHETIGVSVGVDYAQAVKALIQMLADTGFRHIGLLCTQISNTIFKQIMNGWHSGMLGMNQSPHRVVTTPHPPTFTTGHQLLPEIRMTWPELDVLICTTDEVACGSMMACHAGGIAIPSQLAIASIGGGNLSAVCSPPLTTIALPYEAMGKLAGEQLLAVLQGDDVEPYHELPAQLIIRASTGKH